MPMLPNMEQWKPRYSSNSRKEFKNARTDRKKFSKFYDAMCHYCGKNFLDVQSKEIHSATHFLTVKSRSRCNTCMEWFDSGKPFYRHFLGTHTGHGFYCLIKRCGKGRTDKKCVVDHHYANHQYKEYTKRPRDYICETKFIRENLIEPPRGKDPDPDGTIARLLQPKVFLRRLCEGEIEFYSRHPCLYPVQTPINTLDVNKVEELREKLKEVCQNTRDTGASGPSVPFKSGVVNKEKTARFQKNLQRNLTNMKGEFEINNPPQSRVIPVCQVFLSPELIDSLVPIKIPPLQIKLGFSAPNPNVKTFDTVASLTTFLAKEARDEPTLQVTKVDMEQG